LPTDRSPAERSARVTPYAAGCWRDLWELRVQQLAEHGIILSPDAIPSQPLVVCRGDHEWDYHQIGQVYLASRGGFWLAWSDGTPVGHVGAQDLGEGVELRHMYVRKDFCTCARTSGAAGSVPSSSENW
jgi:hypothetical protein